MEVSAVAGSKQSKIFTITGNVLLLLMALLHGSGINYITAQIEASNAESFLKEIFSILFAHPSIHLLGLAAFGILTLSMKHEVKKVKFLIAVLITVDALVAFYLGAVIPGGLLLLSAVCFVLSTIKMKPTERTS